MKNVNKLIMIIFAALSLMPQSVFSMVPQKPTDQPEDTIEFQYISPILRKVKATGTLQAKEGMKWINPDSTWSDNYKWVDIKRTEEEDPIMNLESSLLEFSLEENNKWNNE